MFKGSKVAAVVSAVLATSAFAQDASNEELKKELEKQKAQIEALQLKVETAVTALEEQDSNAGLKNTSLGGYGELHYNNIDTSESIDYHRFVLFIGHKYNDKVSFFSELELEHSLAGDGKPGEVELEQAYIQYDHSNALSLKGGLFLVPVGILNETHEPDTFYGVERNNVEKSIIPATWWEAGAAATYRFDGGMQIDFAAHSGLEVSVDDFSIRSGRQKVAKANADSMAYTTRFKYTGIPGLEVGATVQYQEDITQGVADAEAFLYEAHTAYRTGSFGVRALWAQWNIDSPLADALGADKQNGYYLEPSYKLNEQWGVFARYSAWDTTAGSGSTVDTEKRMTNVGVNYWIHPNVVLKVDTENRLGAHNGSGYNVGLGYQF